MYISHIHYLFYPYISRVLCFSYRVPWAFMLYSIRPTRKCPLPDLSTGHNKLCMYISHIRYMYNPYISLALRFRYRVPWAFMLYSIRRSEECRVGNLSTAQNKLCMYISHIRYMYNSYISLALPFRYRLPWAFMLFSIRPTRKCPLPDLSTGHNKLCMYISHIRYMYNPYISLALRFRYRVPWAFMLYSIR